MPRVLVAAALVDGLSVLGTAAVFLGKFAAVFGLLAVLLDTAVPSGPVSEAAGQLGDVVGFAFKVLAGINGVRTIFGEILFAHVLWKISRIRSEGQVRFE